MQIYGPVHVHGPHATGGPHLRRAEGPQAAGASPSFADQLDISDVGSFVEQVHQLPDVRRDRVEELRAAVASGGYDSDDKLAAALDRLLDEIA